MGRAGRARRIAAAAAFGGGGLTAIGAVGYGVLAVEALLARRVVGRPFGAALTGDGVYGSGPGRTIDLAVLGDSAAAGLGVDRPDQLPGVILATGLSAVAGQPVRLRTVAVVGAVSADLPRQVSELLGPGEETAVGPDLAVVLIGANDVTHRVRPADAVRSLDAAVHLLRQAGTEVVVGTCPDLGTIEPVPQPLRTLARRWSRQLAAAQTIAVVEAGGRTVSVADILGPQFAAAPREMFSADRFHPSAAGYARAAAALLPSLCAAAGLWPEQDEFAHPRRDLGEGIAPVAQAAAEAVDEPGTEVTATSVAGATRGPRGRWALLRRLTRIGQPGETTRPQGGATGPKNGPAPEESAADGPVAAVTGG